jgi:two-component system phosphate regulon response regulator PhoB
LIIDDDRPLANALASILRSQGFEVSMAHDGRRGLRRAQATLPDLIVLDLVLPGLPGLEVCRSLRAGPRTGAIPIVITTVKTEEHDEVIGLAMGADDYVIKPFRMRVLLQRIKRLIARRRARLEPPPDKISQSQGVRINRHSHQATYLGKELPLTRSEYSLLETMLRQPGRAFTRSELISLALGENVMVLDRTIDVHIKSLRKKLGKGAGLIETVRNIGYRFREPRVEEP